MARAMSPTQHKLAERLTILNDRAVGMLTRIYNIKKMLGNPESKPPFFSDKALEPVVKAIIRKFPSIDTKSNSSHSSSINAIKDDVIKSLQLYYYTFVDIMDLKDHVTDLLTTMDASQVQFDITMNYDLTKGYLDLVVTYISIMILLSRVEDRKAVLGLFNFAYELQNNGKPEESFPRLGQLIVDYDPPIKKLADEFIPHAKVLLIVNMRKLPPTVKDIYQKRLGNAESWRSTQFLSLLADSSKIMAETTPVTTAQCDYLSTDVMERWIIVGMALCHQSLATTPALNELWRQCLLNGYVITLCRDEVLLVHPFMQTFFDGIKGYSKKVSEVKELYLQACQNTAVVHREKRKYLRTALKELAVVFTDQPGLLGPKALSVLMALSLARDEFNWLLRHADNVPQKKPNAKTSNEDFVDRQIPELMFHLEELRGLVKKYNQVLQRYYVQYLAGNDASLLNQLIQALVVCPEDESMMLSSFYSTIADLSVKQVEDGELFDFRSLRLDWFRLQAYTSVSRGGGLTLRDHRELAQTINTIVFHTRVVDSLDELLAETSDLSIYCFYTSMLEHQFKQCMEFPAQHRYSIAFPMICAHFMHATHPLCPEERHSIGTTSIQYAHWFLKEMSEEVNQVITAICEEQCMLADKLLPKNSACQLGAGVNKKKVKGNKPVVENEKPGDESKRKHREDFTRMDKLHMALTELCYAINYCSVITVWEHGFVPREFFIQHLEARFNKALVGMMMYNQETKEIAKPSELLNGIKAVMSVLQSIENYVHVDISKVFNSVLPQQCQPTDSFNGDPTICSNYTQWYLEVLMRRVSMGQVVYSPNYKAFVSLVTEGPQAFQAEEFADLMELRALAELMGPYGMKYLSEKLMWHISSQVEELKKLVIQNKETLTALRSNFDKPEQMKELQKKLLNTEGVLQRMTIVGVLLSFRALAQEALLDVLELRVPFLLSSIKDFQHHVPNGQDAMIVNEMASAAGMPCDIDPALCAALRAQKTEPGEDDYNLACLLMVFVAVTIPQLARNNLATFKAALEGHANNVHCLAKAINSLSGAMFTVHGPGDVEMRLKEFLALASSSLLRLGQENDKESIKNRESVYLLLDEIVQESPFLTMDLLESCFPYALLRTSYHHVYKNMEPV